VVLQLDKVKTPKKHFLLGIIQINRNFLKKLITHLVFFITKYFKKIDTKEKALILKGNVLLS
jgi:hypothetical protein